MELNFEKLPIVYKALKDNNIDAWLITGRETIMKREPILHVLGDMDFIIATTLIFTKDEKCIAIVSPLDVECYKLIKGIDEVIEYPTTMEDLMDIADAGAIMPPKSTWFEPKLRSGLFIHKLSD